MSSAAELQLAEWLGNLQAALDDVTPGTGTRFSDAVVAHVADDPIIAFVGEYTAGKSSLIKRLLLDSGAAVPEELFVDASPATDRAYEARVTGWRLRDTAGLDSELSSDAGVAGAAIALAEVIVLSVMATLFSESSDVGRLLASSGRQIAGTGELVVVLTQADRAAGTSGGDRYRNWCQSKSDEVRALLARMGVDGVPVYAVSADARGAVGNREVTADTYDRTRAWDGIDTLRARLLDRPCPPELRRAAVLRGAAREIEHAIQTLDERGRSAAEAVAQLQAEATAINSDRAQLRKFDRESRASLRDALEHAATGGPSQSATARMLLTAERWTSERGQRLEELASKWKIEVDVWAFDPRPVMELPFVQSLMDDDPPDIDIDQAADRLKGGLNSLAGDPDRAAQLEKELQAWKKAKRSSRTREYYDEQGGFGSVRDARDAQRELAELQRRQIAATLGAATLDFLREERDLRQQARARAAADDAARERLEAHATLVARCIYDGLDGGPGWRDALNAIVGELGARATDVTATLEARGVDLERWQVLQTRMISLADPA
jgi:hypothetical protein